MSPLKKKIMIVAGDPSGDIHAAGVVKALARLGKNPRIFGMGGPALTAAGADIREDLTRPAIMGFVEVLRHYPLLRRRFAQCEKWLVEEKPERIGMVLTPN